MKHLILLSFTLFLSFSSFSQWNSNPSENNLVLNGERFESVMSSVSDGSGGIILVLTVSAEIALQKITSSGSIAWGTVSEPIHLFDTYLQATDVTVISDGNGGVFLGYGLRDDDAGYDDIYLQHFNSAGNKLLGAEGLRITNSPLNADRYPSLCLDGAGGVFISWELDNNIDNVQMVVQRCDNEGTLLWDVNGVSVCIAPGFRSGRLVFDGNNSALCFFMDSRNDLNGFDYEADEITNYDIYAQKLDGNGQRLWTDNGIAITTAIGNQEIEETVTSDGLGGGIVLFFDNRNGNDNQAYVQRIDKDGIVSWETNGVIINALDSYPYGIVSDGIGGAVTLTNNFLSDSYRAQKITSTGSVVWGLNGVEINNSQDGEAHYSRDIVADAFGNFIFACVVGFDQNESFVRAQKLSSAGKLEWGASGALVSDANPYLYKSAYTTLSDNGSAIISWADLRNEQTTWGDVYVSKILADGTLAGSSTISEYATTADGNWNSPATWVGGVVPPAGAIVIVRHQVSITQNITCYFFKG